MPRPRPAALIRLATVQDIPAVQAVAKASWHHTYEGILSKQAIELFLSRAYSEYSLRQTLNTGGLLVLEQSKHVSGYARLSLSDNFGFVGAIYLLPELQSRGYGRMLWEEAHSWFRARGVKKISLTVAEKNHRARGFYRHLGFVEGRLRQTKVGGELISELSCHLNLNSSA